MTFDVFAGAAVTALGLAAARCVESNRPDRLIDDPFACPLFLAAGVDLPMRLAWPAPGETVSPAEALHLHGSRYIGLRTRFYDDIVSSAPHDGVRQAVLLGAGLDSRAYRLSLPPDLHLFELDRADLLSWKRATLCGLEAAPNCRLHDIGVDLREDWMTALRGGGFDPDRRTVVIAEGLLPYLAPDEQGEFMKRVTEICVAGSTFVADRIAGDPQANHRLEHLSRRSGIDMQSLIAPGATPILDVLTRCGWIVEEESVESLANAYGRDLSDPFANAVAEPAEEPPWLDTTFVIARRSGDTPVL